MAYEFQDLTRLFEPRSIALVGASDRPNSIGAHALNNLTTHSRFSGDLFLVNPGKEEIDGRRCHSSISALPAAPDVALIVIPAAGVVDAVEQAAARKVPFAVILTSGFSEADDEGKAAERKLQEIAAHTGIRIYGPNCPGLCNINRRLGMTFSPAFKSDLRPGPIGLATQGGGLGRGILQGMERGTGFALWSSSGNECDLQVADFIHHMANAGDVRVIVTLIEGIKDGSRFAAAVEHAARVGKPVVGLKVGRSEYGARAAQSHTASITGSAEVNSEVFRQFGVIEVDDIDELVDVSALLARRLPRGGEKVAVFASSGGAASLCADSVGSAGLTLAQFSNETTQELARVLPPFAAIANPVDTTSVTISNPSTYEQSLLPVAEDPNVSLVVLPIAMDYGTYSANVAQMTVATQAKTATPLCPIWMSDRIGEGYKIFDQAGITPFRSLRNMGKAVRRWIEYGRWRSAFDPAWRPLLLTKRGSLRGEQTRALTEVEAKSELLAAGVPVSLPRIAVTATEAARITDEMGVPVAMKIVSPDIIHKSDIGGVKLGIANGTAAAEAFVAIMGAVGQSAPDARLQGVLVEPMAPAAGLEAFVGVARDPVFGYVMTFGLGGIFVEIFHDVTRRMLPVSCDVARTMVDELRSSALFHGARGTPPRDLAALAELIEKVSDYVAANADSIEELDLNPVWVGAEGQGAMALDAVVVMRA
jgi:acetate---CoA ligase (ADP-forming)